jgi:hypothetical protein
VFQNQNLKISIKRGKKASLKRTPLLAFSAPSKQGILSSVGRSTGPTLSSVRPCLACAHPKLKTSGHHHTTHKMRRQAPLSLEGRCRRLQYLSYRRLLSVPDTRSLAALERSHLTLDISKPQHIISLVLLGIKVV